MYKFQIGDKVKVKLKNGHLNLLILHQFNDRFSKNYYELGNEYGTFMGYYLETELELVNKKVNSHPLTSIFK